MVVKVSVAVRNPAAVGIHWRLIVWLAPPSTILIGNAVVKLKSVGLAPVITGLVTLSVALPVSLTVMLEEIDVPTLVVPKLMVLPGTGAEP